MGEERINSASKAHLRSRYVEKVTSSGFFDCSYDFQRTSTISWTQTLRLSEKCSTSESSTSGNFRKYPIQSYKQNGMVLWKTQSPRKWQSIEHWIRKLRWPGRNRDTFRTWCGTKGGPTMMKRTCVLCVGVNSLVDLSHNGAPVLLASLTNTNT